MHHGGAAGQNNNIIVANILKMSLNSSKNLFLLKCERSIHGKYLLSYCSDNLFFD
jgi:hypothetical protein